jgi:uncharacterized protein YjiK
MSPSLKKAREQIRWSIRQAEGILIDDTERK